MSIFNPARRNITKRWWLFSLAESHSFSRRFPRRSVTLVFLCSCSLALVQRSRLSFGLFASVSWFRQRHLEFIRFQFAIALVLSDMMLRSGFAASFFFQLALAPPSS
jgi:hypothetical protein